MCGIVGCIAREASRRSEEVVMAGLARLEYRGYDSAGIATVSNAGLDYRKKAGKLANLQEKLEGEPLADATAAIGHTRWATHGSPSDTNSHPHVVDGGALALIHNGIIENASLLMRRIQKDHDIDPVSETDTEVVAHLLALTYHDVCDSGVTPGVDALAEAMRRVMPELQGTFTLLAIHRDCPDAIVAARRSSPLVIGLGDGQNYLGSDALAFSEWTDQCLEIGQDQMVVVTSDSVRVYDTHGNRQTPHEFTVDFSHERTSKGGWATYMEKEIHEQPRAVAETLENRTDEQGYLTLDELRISADVLRQLDKVIIIACGTAAYAGQVARYAIEHWCRIPCEVELAHEFRYRDPVLDQQTLVVAVSQSGETMDTIMAVRHAREQGARVLAIVNTPGSTISRESDAVLLTHAGPEIAVASTKAFTAQVTACYLLGLYLAQVRGNKYIDEIQDYLEKLSQIPDKMQTVLNTSSLVNEVARELGPKTESVIFLGRHVGYPIALEGALKLKEIAYIHAEGFAAGELKHGPIALVDEGQVVVTIVPTPRRPELHRKVISNIQEVRARGAYTIVVAEEGDDAVNEFAEVVFRVPQTPTLYMPLLSAIPLQIFACEVATARGCDVDQPRNLAKSVTVE
ncbi:MAG: glutamine--fructose-6-phosphate transaminase (isomerizing) [Actinomycetaceae bacterium]|nr:glutamine--fructose-6-phosphate transaminase (isomerizing) [Actinomycetaceae bacterium]